MRALGMDVRVCGPASLLPLQVESLGVRACTDLEVALRDADIIMVLRLQLERQEKGLIPSLREYSQLYGLNLKRLELAKPDVLIMHPGPINRGVEIAPEVAEGPYSLILDQVANGVALRMALLYLLAGGAGVS
jgi:aspartate carbamoyltransferase catalytic subunit